MTDLVIPEGHDVVRSLPSETLYRLELAGQIATEILDERVIDWTNDGWSQNQIAEELGCKQPAVSKRQKRLGIESLNTWKQKSGGGDNRGIPQTGDNGYDDAEEVDPDEVFDPAPGAHYYPDVVAEDADENLRTVALYWFEWGLSTKRLLDENVPLEAKSPADRRAIYESAGTMAEIAHQLRKATR